MSQINTTQDIYERETYRTIRQFKRILDIQNLNVGNVVSTDGTQLIWSTGSSGGGTWGSITGTLSAQTDLQSALDLKATLASPTFTGTVVLPSTTSIGTVSSTEIGYLDNVTSSIQTQLNAKQATITGGATTITSSDLTVSRALVSDGSGKVAVATTTSTEIGYVNGVTSAIQTQLNSKLSSASFVPAGSNTQIQFNNSGAFGASANLTWDGTNLLTGIVSTTSKIGVNTSTFFAGAQVAIKASGSIPLNLTGTTAAKNLCFGLDATEAYMAIDVGPFSLYSPTARVLTIATSNRVGIGVLAPTATLDILGESLTGSSAVSALNIAQTWNTTGAPTAIKLNVTNTASSASSLLLDLQASTASKFKVTVAGNTTVGGTLSVASTLTGDAAVFNAQGVTSGDKFVIAPINGGTFTSGNATLLKVQHISGGGFAPTSGTGTHTMLELSSTINQTGGANGITRGLYINPTLTAAADFRAFESTNGKVILTDTFSAVTGSLAGSLLTLNQTFNTTGTPTAVLLNVTNTASNAASKAFDVQIGGTSAVAVRVDGKVGFGTQTFSDGTQYAMARATDGIVLNLVGATTRMGFAVGSAENFIQVQSGPLTLWSPTARVFSLSSNGRIGIGDIIAPLAGLHNVFNSIASVPAKLASGTWFTGGSATTTKPHWLIEPTGATSTAWSTSGTGLGVNAASGFAGNLIDAQLNGVSKFTVDSTGYVTLQNGGSTPASGIQFTNNTTRVERGAGGNALNLYGYSAVTINSTQSSNLLVRFDQNGIVQFGGTTSSFPALKRVTTGLQVRLADDSADTTITASNVISTATVRLKGYTVATLPAGVVGDLAYVTDALTPAFGVTVVGGGAVVTPVFYDGTTWTAR